MIYYLLLPLIYGSCQASDQAPDFKSRPKEISHYQTLTTECLNEIDKLFESMVKTLHISQDAQKNSYEKAKQLETELRDTISELQKENECILALQEELIITKKDLQAALEKEAETHQKLELLEKESEKKINRMHQEYINKKTTQDSTPSSKIFW